MMSSDPTLFVLASSISLFYSFANLICWALHGIDEFGLVD